MTVSQKVEMGITERKEREKNQRQADIVAAAEQIFFSKGYENATMDDVAKAAELAKGTLYLYFKSKEELLLAIHLKTMVLLVEKTLEIKSLSIPAPEKMRQIAMFYLNYSKTHVDQFKVMLKCESNLVHSCIGTITPDCCDLHSKQQLRSLIEIIGQGMIEGELRNDLNPIFVVLQLMGSLTGMFTMFINKGDLLHTKLNFNEEEILADFIDRYISTLLPIKDLHR